MNNRFIFKISALFATALLIPGALFAQNNPGEFMDVPGDFDIEEISTAEIERMQYFEPNDSPIQGAFVPESAGTFKNKATKVNQQPLPSQPLGTPRTNTGPGTGPLQGGIQGTTGTGPLTGEFKGSGSVFYDPNTSLQISSSELTAGADCQSNGLETYCLLAPIDSDKEIKTDEYGFFYYINKIINYAFGLAGIVAVLALVAGGLQYIASGTSLTQAQGGRDRINKAFIGLGIMLASYLLLYTISPELVQFQLKIPDICSETDKKKNGGRCPTVSQVERAPAPAPTLTQQVSGPNSLNVQPIGNAINPRLTTYSPRTNPNDPLIKLEGEDATKYDDLEGKRQVHTIDDYIAGKTNYITLAGDDKKGPTYQIGRYFIIPKLTYKSKDGTIHTRENVPAYVHDRGSAFVGKGATHFDVAVGRDYTQEQQIQPYNEYSTPIVPAAGIQINK